MKYIKRLLMTISLILFIPLTVITMCYLLTYDIWSGEMDKNSTIIGFNNLL
jgi:hypothetical protein